MIKKCLLILVLVCAHHSYSQSLDKDTLYFKSGMVRSCRINFFDKKNVNYTYVSKKNDTLTHDVKQDQLKYFVLYDSLHTLVFSSQKDNFDEFYNKENSLDSTGQVLSLPDSMDVYKTAISFNPFSVPLLSVNLKFTYRFGEDLKYGLFVPVRTLPFLIVDQLIFYTGIGFSFYMMDSPKFSYTLDFATSFYLVEGESLFALPISFGFVRYFKPRFGLSGNLGAGPAFSSDGIINYPMPTGHIGLTFFLGKKITIPTDQRR